MAGGNRRLGTRQRMGADAGSQQRWRVCGGAARLLDFLANNVEQLDLALEQILLGDANNARFGLMLTDNAVEITLHQIALEAQATNRLKWHDDKPYEYATELRSALGRDFSAKLKFAKVVGKIDAEAAGTVTIGHRFRNQVYHLGLQHEAVLPAMSAFYFEVACAFLADYSPGMISYLSGKALPPRARRHFGEGPYFPDPDVKYKEACMRLGAKTRVEGRAFAADLADHLDELLDVLDAGIGTVAGMGSTTRTRDEAVEETMAWWVAFSDEGKKAAALGWPGGSVADYVQWIRANCQLPMRKDPIARWRKRAHAVRGEGNRHAALRKYWEFMDQTARTRGILDEAHAQAEQQIDLEIQRWKEERYWR